MDGTVDRTASRESLNWQQERRRPDGLFDWPVTGFGSAATSYTLWVPSPRPRTTYAFEDGEPVRRTTGACFEDAALAEARLRCIAAMRMDRDRVLVDLNFLRYVASVVRRNYVLTDLELEMLLGGNRWHRDMVAHLFGGPDTAAAFIAAGQARVPAGGQAAGPAAAVTPPALTNPPRRGPLARLFRR